MFVCLCSQVTLTQRQINRLMMMYLCIFDYFETYETQMSNYTPPEQQWKVSTVRSNWVRRHGKKEQ